MSVTAQNDLGDTLIGFTPEQTQALKKKLNLEAKRFELLDCYQLYTIEERRDFFGFKLPEKRNSHIFL